MRRRSLCLVVALLATAGCSSQPPAAPIALPTASPPQIPGARFGDFIVGDPLHFGNLTIFPISSSEPRFADRFITLDEGLAEGTVNVVEVGAERALAGNAHGNRVAAPVDSDTADSVDTNVDDSNRVDADPFDGHELADEDEPFGGEGAEVNRLMIINTSTKPLYLLPGEVVSGGQQDRTIGEEVVIQPGKEPTAIEAFCVEHGRWSDRDLGHTAQLLASLHASGGAVVGLNSASGAAAERPFVTSVIPVVASGVPEPEVGSDADEIGGPLAEPTESVLALAAADANRGKFVASAGALGKAARMAVQAERDQGRVWNEVGEVNEKTGNRLTTGNFTGNYANPEIADQLAPYVDRFQQPVRERAQVVGVVVAVNGEVQTVDVFESTPLFHKFWPKLIKSYALDALTSQKIEDAEAPADTVCTIEKCLTALKQLEEAQAGSKELDGGMVQVKRESKHVISFSISDKSAAEAMGGAMGGFGGSIHGGGFY